MAKPSLLVTGLCPDGGNTNTRIRSAIEQGARQTGLFARIEQMAIEGVLARDTIGFDIVLAVGSGTVDTVPFASLSKRVRASGGVLAFWTHEDPYEFDLNARLVNFCDFFFTNEIATLPFYDDDRVSWLPLAGDQDYDRPIRPFKERPVDLFFCGYGYPLRLHILGRILANDNNLNRLAILGPNLKDELGEKAFDKRLSTREMADACSRAKLVLNIGRDLSIANNRFNIIAETPGPRTFDVALSGTPQLLFDDGLMIEHFYEPGREILLFDNADDVGAAIANMQRYPEEGEKIAMAARERTMSEHLYRHRIEAIMKEIGA